MTTERFFAILGISITKDLDVIKNAYRNKLVNVNPEDDPEGFKRLRESYEEAMRYAEEDEKEKDEIDLWIDQLAQIYNSMEKRIQPESYKELFKDELCQNLDTADVVKDRFLGFVSEHCYLPQEIFVLFDQEFHILRDLDRLKEKFNPNFLAFFKKQTLSPGFLNYHLFKCTALDEQEVDYDEYIFSYFEIKRHVDEGNLEKATELLKGIASIDIYHPYMDVEKLRIKVENKDFEHGLIIADQLMKQDIEDAYILYYCGQFYYENKQYDQAFSNFNALIQKDENHFGANYYIARYDYERGNLKKAKEHVLRMLDIYPGNRAYEDMLSSINKDLSEDLYRQYEETKELSIALEYGWCLYQEERYEEAVGFLTPLKEEGESEYEFIDLYSRSLACAHHPDAFVYLTRWRNMILEAKDDGSIEYQKKMNRLSECNRLLGDFMLEHDQYNEAITYFEEGLKVEPIDYIRFSYMDCISHCYIKMRAYERAIDVCEEILKKNPNYFWAYCNRQEAYFGMRNGQGVIDDYFNAIRIYAGNSKPYLFAMKAFYNYRQYQDALKVYENAEKNGVVSSALQLERFRALRMSASDSEYEKLSEDFEKFALAEKKNKKSDIEAKDLIAIERAMFFSDKRMYKEAVKCCLEALKYAPDSPGYCFSLADFYVKLSDYKNALKYYKIVAQKWPNNSAVYVEMGKCYKNLGKYKEAEPCYLKAIELNDTKNSAYHHLGILYNCFYGEVFNKEWLLKAIEQENIQLSIMEKPLYYRWRGYFYRRAGMFKEAIQDFKKCIALSETDFYCYNQLGYTYRAMSEFDKAIEAFQAGIAAMNKYKRRNSDLHYNLAKTYRILGRFEEAEEEYRINCDMYPNENDAFDDLFNLYLSTKQDEKATKFIKKREKMPENCDSRLDEIDACLNKFWMKAFNHPGDKKLDQQILTFAKEKELQLRSSDYRTLYSLMAECFGDYEGALWVLDHIEKEKLGLGDKIRYGERRALCYYLLGDKNKAKKQAKKILNLILKEYKTEETFLDYPQAMPVHAGQLGKLYAYMGDYEKSFYYIEMMTYDKKCQHCDYKDCHERDLWYGIIFYGKGEIEKAKSHFENVIKINPNDWIARLYMKILKEQ